MYTPVPLTLQFSLLVALKKNTALKGLLLEKLPSFFSFRFRLDLPLLRLAKKKRTTVGEPLHGRPLHGRYRYQNQRVNHILGILGEKCSVVRIFGRPKNEDMHIRE